jgi:hypothetical protein
MAWKHQAAIWAAFNGSKILNICRNATRLANSSCGLLFPEVALESGEAIALKNLQHH